MRSNKQVLLVLYFFTLIYIVFISRNRQEMGWHVGLINLIPVKNTLKEFCSLETHPTIKWWNFASNFFGNILIFLPIPFFITALFKISNTYLIIGFGVLISMLIEFLQFFLQIGVPDIDDVILNSIGVVVGVYLYKIISEKRKQTQ